MAHIASIITFLVLFISIEPVFSQAPPIANWPDNMREDWFSGQQTLQRPLLICVAQGNAYSSSFWMVVQAGNNQTVAANFPSQNDCINSLQEMRPGVICSPSQQFLGSYYIQSLSDGRRLGTYFPSQADCLEGLSHSRRRNICMLSQRYNGKYFIHNLSTNRTIHKDSYFADKQSCLASLHESVRGFVCLASNRINGNFYIFSLRRGQGIEGYYSDQESCLQNVKSSSGGFICTPLPSTSYTGRAAIIDSRRDSESQRQVGNSFATMADCQRGLNQSRSYQVCMQSNRYNGYYFFHDINRNQPQGDSHYFTSRESCESSMASIKDNYTCMPSSRIHGNFYLHDLDLVNTKHLVQYFSNQDQCLLSLASAVELRGISGCHGANAGVPNSGPNEAQSFINGLTWALQYSMAH